VAVTVTVTARSHLPPLRQNGGDPPTREQSTAGAMRAGGAFPGIQRRDGAHSPVIGGHDSRFTAAFRSRSTAGGLHGPRLAERDTSDPTAALVFDQPRGRL
jgi:hypothetical protein